MKTVRIEPGWLRLTALDVWRILNFTASRYLAGDHPRGRFECGRVPLLVCAVVAGRLLFYRAPSYGWLSPASQARIAFMSDRLGNWQVYLMHRDGSNLRNLTRSTANNGFPPVNLTNSPGTDFKAIWVE